MQILSIFTIPITFTDIFGQNITKQRFLHIICKIVAVSEKNVLLIKNRVKNYLKLGKIC